MARALTTKADWESVTAKSYPSRWSRADRELASALHPYLNVMRGCRVLEIGCGNSYWLPYFRRRYGMTPHGIDFSAQRLVRARRNLPDVAQDNLVLGDFVTGEGVPSHWAHRFDIVLSFGVVEHFVPPSGALRAAARYIREEGGLLISTAPNLKGIWGDIDEVTSVAADKYVRMNLDGFVKEHIEAQLFVLHASYIRWSDASVLSLSRVPPIARATCYMGITITNLLLLASHLLPNGVLPNALYSDMLVVARGGAR